MYHTQEKYDTNNKPDRGMEKIGNILTSMMKQVDNGTRQNNNDNDERIMKRILTLEQKVEYLIYKIKTGYKGTHNLNSILISEIKILFAYKR
jgi:phosphate uptake regulator